MNKTLQTICVATASCVLALSGGCASAPTAVSALDNQKQAPQKQPTTDKTVFTEAQIAAMVNDDFWGNGATATVDDEGRLTYIVPTKVVNDGSINNYERNGVQTRNGRFYYIDPATGRPVIAVGAGQQRGVFVGNRGGGQRYSGPGPTSVQPRVVSPRGESRSAPASRGTRSTRDNRN